MPPLCDLETESRTHEPCFADRDHHFQHRKTAVLSGGGGMSLDFIFTVSETELWSRLGELTKAPPASPPVSLC